MNGPTVVGQWRRRFINNTVGVSGRSRRTLGVVGARKTFSLLNIARLSCRAYPIEYSIVFMTHSNTFSIERRGVDSRKVKE